MDSDDDNIILIPNKKQLKIMEERRMVEESDHKLTEELFGCNRDITNKAVIKETNVIKKETNVIKKETNIIKKETNVIKKEIIIIN